MQKRDSEGRIIKSTKSLFEKEPIVDDCLPCIRHDKKVCSAYLSPAQKWRLGDCPLATHVIVLIKEDSGKKRIGQQKQKIKR